MAKKKKARRKAEIKLTAKTADRHRLYEKTVQAPEFEVELLTKTFERLVGRRPLSLREDFCGTALLCATWVESDAERSATGIDLDPGVLAWGRANHIDVLDEGAARRITLLRQDVRKPSDDRHDIVSAFNYSYFCFKDRETLRGYFETARSHLVDDGLFIIDLFGGWEAQQVLEEERKYKNYRYVWHQAAFNPIDAAFKAHIHFRFNDGSTLERAFTYDWRLWTLPELRELLREAGFTFIEVLWEEEDEDGEGSGTFKPRKRVNNDPGYNAYLVASVDEPARKRAKRAEGP